MSNPEAKWREKVSVLYDADTIRKRIAELGAQITRELGDSDVVAVGILKGCFMFFSDLVKQIDLPLSCEFIGISSYGDDTKSSGVVQITSDLTHPIEGRNVLIIEDIIDTGLTIQYLKENFATRHPKSMKICSLLHKAENTRVKLDIDYIGFEIPNEFVVGYGLDLAGRYRNLPYIGVYNEEA